MGMVVMHNYNTMLAPCPSLSGDSLPAIFDLPLPLGKCESMNLPVESMNLPVVLSGLIHASPFISPLLRCYYFMGPHRAMMRRRQSSSENLKLVQSQSPSIVSYGVAAYCDDRRRNCRSMVSPRRQEAASAIEMRAVCMDAAGVKSFMRSGSKAKPP